MYCQLEAVFQQNNFVKKYHGNGSCKFPQIACKTEMEYGEIYNKSIHARKLTIFGFRLKSRNTLFQPHISNFEETY